MPRRISKEDDFTIARRVVEQAIGEPLTPKSVSPTVSKIMSQMGRRGGKLGGKRRLVTMTPEKRSEIALKAAKARWNKTPEK